MADYLSRELILELKTAIVEAELFQPGVRDILLYGLDPGYLAALPTRASPLLQIWSDLEDMNGVAFLETQQVPLCIWLGNAVHYLKTTGRAEVVVFHKALAQVMVESEHRLEAVPGAGFYADPVARAYYLDLLRNFLLPFQGVLRLTRHIFEGLRDERELHALELHPGRLQAYFAALPEEDPRKHLWNLRIDELQEQNRRGAELVEKHYGRIISDGFRIACDLYRQHVTDWAMVWRGLKGQLTLEEPYASLHTLWAPSFPAGLDEALDAETQLVKQRAGEI